MDQVVLLPGVSPFPGSFHLQLFTAVCTPVCSGYMRHLNVLLLLLYLCRHTLVLLVLLLVLVVIHIVVRLQSHLRT